ncbi:hydroxypyruvate isomerase family protein [Jiella sonneratiae]|uniref:TIM barrel protein n=1 Tax=Jiella sonneratiae TaxID=2816856 RepID=A0ABS3J4Y4_9HYPH|nr:TIM barrel protein [Jiella sonneratiae]MBO0904731.1 TIM barrel protein [Jiella sonneratiae]
MRFSANLGFLWTQMPLAEAIRRAKAAGFDAVECHWPYGEDREAVRGALAETGLPMLGLNTRKGSQPGDFGLAAVPGREAEARAAIDEAFDYGAAIGARAVHVMAGKTADPRAAEVFDANLTYACDLARDADMTVLIEPLNPRDAPGYFLIGLDKAAATVERLGRPELKIMFDCYHLQITGGDLIERFKAHRAMVGHVQFAAVPSRAEPDEGEVAYDRLLPALAGLGYDAAFGAEYRPRGTTEAGLGWLARYRAGTGAG